MTEITNAGILQKEYEYENISILEELKELACKHTIFKIWMWRVYV